MKKIWIFVLVLWMALISSQAFWYFEDKLYCDFERGNITLFLKNEAWMSKCKLYLDTIYQHAMKRYKEISAINSYIDQWNDVYYWKEVLEEKKLEFLQLVNYRAQIKTAIDQFETRFFDRYFSILQQPMQTYYSNLENQYYILVNQKISSKDSSKKSQIEQQMSNISKILDAKNMDELMMIIPSYIYLRTQLVWI